MLLEQRCQNASKYLRTKKMCAKVENAQVGQLKRAQEPWEGKNVYKYIKLTRFQKRFPNIVFCVVAALKSSVSFANLDPLFCIKTVHGRYFANTKLYLRAVTDIDFFAVLIRNHFLITYCRLAITKSAKKLSNSAGKLVFFLVFASAALCKFTQKKIKISVCSTLGSWKFRFNKPI